MTDSTKGCCRDGDGAIPNILHNMEFTLSHIGGCLGNTQGGAGGVAEGQRNVVKTRYDVYKAFADGVVVATDDNRRIICVYSVVVDKIVAKFLFQSLLREEYIIVGGDHSLF